MKEIQRVQRPALKVRKQAEEDWEAAVTDPKWWKSCNAHAVDHRQLFKGSSMRNLHVIPPASNEEQQASAAEESNSSSNCSVATPNKSGSAYVWVRGVDLRTEGGTRLLKVLKDSSAPTCKPLCRRPTLVNSKLARPVILDFADKCPKVLGDRSNEQRIHGGCSLSKFTDLKPSFRQGGKKYQVKMQKETSASRKLTINDMESLEKIFTKPSHTPFTENVRRHFDDLSALGDNKSWSSFSKLLQLIDTYSGADSEPEAREWWENDPRHTAHGSTSQVEVEKDTILRDLLKEIAKGIVAKDESDNAATIESDGVAHDEVQRTYFEDEQRRSAYSLEINERRLEHLDALIRVENVAQLNISGCAWQHVYLDNTGTQSLNAESLSSLRGFCVDNRRLFLEDLLRAAVPVYTIHIHTSRRCFKSSLEEHPLATLFHRPLPAHMRRDRIRVHFGSAEVNMTFTLEQIKSGVDELRNQYEEWSARDLYQNRQQQAM